MLLNSTMKKLSIYITCVTCLSLVLSSCFYVPDADAKYDASFYDTYAVKDYNLFYLDANAHDGMIKTKSDQEYDWDRLYVATIPETSEAQFVIGIRETYYITGGNSNHFCIYQSKDAPIPRKDWTFSEIKIIKNDWVGGPSRSNPNYKSYYRDMIEGSSYDYSWLESGADPVLAEELHTSFGSALIKNSEKNAEQLSLKNRRRALTNTIFCVLPLKKIPIWRGWQPSMLQMMVTILDVSMKKEIQSTFTRWENPGIFSWRR